MKLNSIEHIILTDHNPNCWSPKLAMVLPTLFGARKIRLKANHGCSCVPMLDDAGNIYALLFGTSKKRIGLQVFTPGLIELGCVWLDEDDSEDYLKAKPQDMIEAMGQLIPLVKAM